MTAFSEERHDVNGVDTAVFTAGEGAPIVVLHGGGTAPGFDELLPLAEHGRLILPIHPGFGASGDATGLDSLQDYVRHYLDLLDRLGLDEVSLVGASLGGYLACEIAILQPRRVRRLVLMAPWGLLVPEHPTLDIFSIPPERLMEYLYADLTPLRRPASAPAGVPRRAGARGRFAGARDGSAIRPQPPQVAPPRHVSDADPVG